MLFWHLFAKSVPNIGGGAKPYSCPLSKYWGGGRLHPPLASRSYAPAESSDSNSRRWKWNLVCQATLPILISLLKMNKFYQAVQEIGPIYTTTCRNVSVTSHRSGPEYDKFWIFKIGPLLREIYPFSLRHVMRSIGWSSYYKMSI